MTPKGFTAFRAGQAVPRAGVPELPFADFRRAVVDATPGGLRVAALFGDAPAEASSVDLYAVLADAAHGLLRVGKTTLDSDHFPSLTLDCPSPPILPSLLHKKAPLETCLRVVDRSM